MRCYFLLSLSIASLKPACIFYLQYISIWIINFQGEYLICI